MKTNLFLATHKYSPGYAPTSNLRGTVMRAFSPLRVVVFTILAPCAGDPTYCSKLKPSSLFITVIVKLAITPSGRGPHNVASLSLQTKKILPPSQCSTVHVGGYLNSNLYSSLLYVFQSVVVFIKDCDCGVLRKTKYPAIPAATTTKIMSGMIVS